MNSPKLLLVVHCLVGSKSHQTVVYTADVMIPSISSSRFYRVSYLCYVVLFFIFLITPLLVVAAFSFNDSLFPSLRWNGFTWDWYLGENAPRLGLVLVSLGQFAFITTIATLVISTRLRKFDITQEEAAMNPGASRMTAIATVTLAFLKPALLGAGVVAFLMSFENFNTTLMLAGSDTPLTIAMFDRLREGSTPVLNAASVLLMAGSAYLALVSLFAQRPDKQ